MAKGRTPKKIYIGDIDNEKQRNLRNRDRAQYTVTETEEAEGCRETRRGKCAPLSLRDGSEQEGKIIPLCFNFVTEPNYCFNWDFTVHLFDAML